MRLLYIFEVILANTKRSCVGSLSKSAIVKTDGNVFGKIRSDLEDLAFLKRPQGKPSGRSKCLSRRESREM